MIQDSTYGAQLAVELYGVGQWGMESISGSQWAKDEEVRFLQSTSGSLN